MNYRERENINKKQITEKFGTIPDCSGIYVFTRQEKGFKYAYVGQAKHLLTRIAQHLDGYQHIDLSIKKHGLYDKNNPHGWAVLCTSVPEDKLDIAEREYILAFATQGYQLRNKTLGGQDEGKDGIAPNKPAKGYRDGVAQGEKNIRKKVAVFFEKYLDATIKGTPNKTKERKLAEFQEFIKAVDNEQETV